VEGETSLRETLIVLSFLQRGLTRDDASAAYDALEEAGAKAEIQATS